MSDNTIEELHRVVNALATNPNYMQGGGQQFQWNLLNFMKYPYILWEFTVESAETHSFTESKRMEYNRKSLVQIQKTFNSKVLSNQLQVLMLGFVNPYNPEPTFEHRTTLCKTKDSPWYCIESYRRPDLGIEVLPNIR